MKISVNGEPAEAPEGTTVKGLLELREVRMPEMVSVELNGEILPRSSYETTVIDPGAEVEFLYFMGGGMFGEEIGPAERNNPS